MVRIWGMDTGEVFYEDAYLEGSQADLEGGSLAICKDELGRGVSFQILEYGMRGVSKVILAAGGFFRLFLGKAQGGCCRRV
jgi:hypothetical protein